MSLRFFDPFRVLDEQERGNQLAAYREFLASRDGTPDLASRTLSLREDRMRALEASTDAWPEAVNLTDFARCMAGDRSGRFEPRTEWALVAALANESENYGVDIELRRFARHGKLPGLREADLLLSVYVQETYHCRILVEVCRACGAGFAPRRPGLTNRSLVWLIGALPGVLRWVPVMAGELVGTAVFRLLYEGLSLFDARPATRARLRELLEEVWIDEIGHVAFLRAQLGSASLIAVRAMLPLVAAAVLKDLPRLDGIGLTPTSILCALREGVAIPPAVDWIEADVAAPGDAVAELVRA